MTDKTTGREITFEEIYEILFMSDFDRNLFGNWTIEALEYSVKIFNNSEDLKERGRMLDRFFSALIIYGVKTDSLPIIRGRHMHTVLISIGPDGAHCRNDLWKLSVGREGDEVVIYSQKEGEGMFPCSPKIIYYEPINKIHISDIKEIELQQFIGKKFIVLLKTS